jgi:hypothetical protein
MGAPPPQVIYKALNFHKSCCKRGPKGVMPASRAVGFICTCLRCGSQTSFSPDWRKKQSKKLFIGDVLASHISPKVMKLCKTHNIAFVCLPPNSTNKLHPLNVWVGPMKADQKKILTEFKAKVYVNRYGTGSRYQNGLPISLSRYCMPPSEKNLNG